jgi:hypothetical protein
MRSSFLAAAMCLAATAILAKEGGLAVGAYAPPLNGSAWVTEDGKAPDMKNKVLLIDFWFAG